jgi:transposase
MQYSNSLKSSIIGNVDSPKLATFHPSNLKSKCNNNPPKVNKKKVTKLGAGHLSVAFGAAGRLPMTPRAYPEEFHRDVVEIARRNGTPVAEIAKDFGIPGTGFRGWLIKAGTENDVNSATPVKEAIEFAPLREANKSIQLLETENEVLRRALVYQGRDINPKLCSFSCAILHLNGFRFGCLA